MDLISVFVLWGREFLVFGFVVEAGDQAAGAQVEAFGAVDTFFGEFGDKGDVPIDAAALEISDVTLFYLGAIPDAQAA